MPDSTPPIATPPAPDTPDAIRNRVWFDTMAQRLGSSQLTHAIARLDRLERVEAKLQRWQLMLSCGRRAEVDLELRQFVA